MGSFRTAIPVFIGIVLGIYLLAAGLSLYPAAGVVALVFAAGWIFEAAGRSLLRRAPVRSVRLWQGSVLMAVSAIAATTYTMTYISFKATGWLALMPDDLVDKIWLSSNAADIGKTLLGALNTLVAALWLDDAKSPTGKLWPSGQIKEGLKLTFRDLLERWKVDEDQRYLFLRRAVSGDMATDKISGWDFDAIVGRADMIERLEAGIYPLPGGRP